ncbi:hypothetical protein [Kineococcus sp. SYSU DK005]|uniref:hypothetical protein n=1 Tax=Kineococcus sp. SYSU DK005 TaxID=3383126 RepID=UPI003D7C82BC
MSRQPQQSSQSSQSSRAGFFVPGGLFSLIGVAVLLLAGDLSERSPRGVPLWLLGALLLACGIGLIIAGLRRGRS